PRLLEMRVLKISDVSEVGSSVGRSCPATRMMKRRLPPRAAQQSDGFFAAAFANVSAGNFGGERLGPAPWRTAASHIQRHASRRDGSNTPHNPTPRYRYLTEMILLGVEQPTVSTKKFARL